MTRLLLAGVCVLGGILAADSLRAFSPAEARSAEADDSLAEARSAKAEQAGRAFTSNFTTRSLPTVARRCTTRSVPKPSP